MSIYFLYLYCIFQCFVNKSVLSVCVFVGLCVCVSVLVCVWVVLYSIKRNIATRNLKPHKGGIVTILLISLFKNKHFFSTQMKEQVKPPGLMLDLGLLNFSCWVIFFLFLLSLFNIFFLYFWKVSLLMKVVILVGI